MAILKINLLAMPAEKGRRSIVNEPVSLLVSSSIYFILWCIFLMSPIRSLEGL